ncbi:siderophore-iron reductase FhuF [Pseudomonas sp. NFACC08-1]|uniref:siderophore-iron reductase FhuF n=1 Tax=Pseudomonas sp. NFACC08-1 TaxID=1566238 RepID=UPI00089BBF28|nr:siderophore-iron reductase FhuF [Pseudomonas sp. NFACC08-1]SDW52823.1 ferric iron reductase protein FhuF [Pseudomonas sp. NFACC08-1]
MIPSLAPLFTGPLADHGEKLQLRSHPRTDVPGDRFFQHEYFGAFVDDLQARYKTDERLALVSLWSKWYFSTFLAPVMAANLLQQCDLPLALADTGIQLGNDARPQALHLPHAGQPLPACTAFERFHTLVEDHLEPVIETLVSVSQASPRLFWSNAGNTFEFVTSRIDLHPLANAYSTAPAKEILNTRLRPNGRRNPLFAPVQYRDIGEDEPQRLRRICCIRYRLPGVGYCSSCPLDECKRQELPV